MVFGILEVHLVKGKNLKTTDFLGCLGCDCIDKIDPCVVIHYKGQVRKSTVLRGKGRNPVWNEKFRFKAEYPSENDDYKLIIKAYDGHGYTQDDFIGTATIYVKDLLAIGMERGTSEMHAAANIYRVVLEDGTYCGELQLGVKFKKVEYDIDEEELGGWKESH